MREVSKTKNACASARSGRSCRRTTTGCVGSDADEGREQGQRDDHRHEALAGAASESRERRADARRAALGEKQRGEGHGGSEPEERVEGRQERDVHQ